MGISAGPDIITDGLVLELDAGDRNSYPGTGTTWRDLSGNSNNGTLTNGPTFNTGSLGSIVFDGVDDYTAFNTVPILTNQVTSEIWINITATNGVQFIFGKETAYRLLAFYNHPGSPNQLTWVCATTNNSWYSTGTFIDYPTSITGWKQIVGVYDGTKNLLYVNGTLVVTGSAISGNIASGIGNLTLMSNNGVSGLLFGKGNVSSFKQYNKALSSQEILQNYTAMKTRFGL